MAEGHDASLHRAPQRLAYKAEGIRLESLPSQSNTIISRSVVVGDDTQLKHTTLFPVLNISPKNVAVLLLLGQ